MQLNTSQFGAITVDENAIISFPDGIPGFEHTQSYVLVPHTTTDGQATPFRWLQCVEEPNLALPVVNPWTIRSDYAPTIGGSTMRQVGITDVKNQAQFLAIVTIPTSNPTGVTVNLLAPILINREHRVGKQVIVQNESYSIRTPLLNPVTEEKVEARRPAMRSMAAAAA